MRRTLQLTALVALLYCLLFHGLAARELWSSHEARAAQDAQSILDGGDWRLPRLFDGRPELQKPPLYYWITAGIGWLRGTIDELTVRLPAVISSLLTGLALWFLLRQSGLNRAAWLAAIILWTMLHFTWMSRVGRIDMPLTCATTWAIVSFLQGMQITNWHRHAWFLLGYLCLAAGLMLKGPIAAILLTAVLIPWLFIRHRFTPAPDHGRLYLLASALWGVPLLIALILPWCWWVNDATSGKFIEEFVVKHNMQRAGLGGDEQLDGHVHPWWFYLARLWIDTAPWGLLLPVVLMGMIRRRLSSPWAWLGLLWFGSILILLSCLQYKRADYLLPAYPGLALLLGICIDGWWAQLSEQQQQRGIRWSMTLVACIAAGWFTYITWLLPQYESQKSLRPFAQRVREYLPAPGQVILFRIDSHHLTWELGKKTERIWEWENLSWWATRPAPIFVVMPEKYALECKKELLEGELIPLLSNGKHDVPLVLLVNGHGRALAQR